MKKGLLMTSAIVAAGMLALGNDAQAQAQKPTNPVQLRLGGYLENTVGEALQRPKAQAIGANPAVPFAAGAGGTTSMNTFDVQTESEIHIIGDGRLDNGLVIRTVFEMEVSGSPGQLWDEAYLILRNGFGQVILGNEDPVSELMTAGYGNGLVANAGLNLTYDSQAWVPQPGTFTASPTISAARAAFIEAPDNNDSTKLIYVTPRFFGFQGGISYAPEYRGQLWDGNGTVGINTGGGAADTNKRLPAKDLLHDLWSGSINYDSLEIGSAKIGFAIGYTSAQKPMMVNGKNGESYNTSSVKEWGGGTRVDVGGFRFTAGYKAIRNTEGTPFAGSTTTSAAAAGGVNTSLFSTLVAGTSDDGYGVNVGAMYHWGPNAVSWTGRHGTERGALAVAGQSTSDHQTIDGSLVSYARTLAPGIKWTANWFYAAYRDQKQRDIDNHGNALVSSIRLDF
jgi:outer membrane protein OmpU